MLQVSVGGVFVVSDVFASALVGHSENFVDCPSTPRGIQKLSLGGKLGFRRKLQGLLPCNSLFFLLLNLEQLSVLTLLLLFCQ